MEKILQGGLKLNGCDSGNLVHGSDIFFVYANPDAQASFF
jgi:hypothetical protein